MDNKFKIFCLSYNNEKWVSTHINSILNQTYDNYEVFYLDDCSTDNTLNEVKKLVGNNDKFKIVSNPKNVGNGTANTMNYFDEICDNENDIYVHLDGDDWFADSKVLEKINKEYVENDYWMTYGFYVAWHGGQDLRRASDTPDTVGQCLPHDDFVHKHSLYRQDKWRATHLRTYRNFLLKNIDKNDCISKIDNEYFWKAGDLSWAFPCLEMCPPEKIGNMEFITYVYNRYPENYARSVVRDSDDNRQYDIEIRNKKKYKRVSKVEELNGEKLPQVNVFGDFRERHTIPKDFSYVYNQTFGDFDLVVLQDNQIINYLDGNIKINKECPIIADVCEPPHLFEQKNVYERVKREAHKFDRILNWSKDLEDLPNYKFKPIVEISQWNLLPETELDKSLFRIYPKNKLVSFITSNKTLSDGHKFRLSCLDKVRENVDAYGRGINEIKCKLDGMKDYRFSVTVENGKFDNWFTEKIIDCFLSGTIPIYHGCDNIGDFFNKDGIITFNNEEELEDIISKLNDDDYGNRQQAVEDNFNIAFNRWMHTNDIYFNRYLKDMIL